MNEKLYQHPWLKERQDHERAVCYRRHRQLQHQIEVLEALSRSRPLETPDLVLIFGNKFKWS